jgi:glycerol-3-phosphate acyltransferase PlsY
MRYQLDMYVDGSLLVLASAVAIGIVVKHHTNIKRLIKGEENKIQFGAKKKEPQTADSQQS